MAIGPNVIDDCGDMTEEEYFRGMVEAEERRKVPPCLECGLTKWRRLTRNCGRK